MRCTSFFDAPAINISPLRCEWALRFDLGDKAADVPAGQLPIAEIVHSPRMEVFYASSQIGLYKSHPPEILGRALSGNSSPTARTDIPKTGELMIAGAGAGEED
jgi:hypothetical protein